MKTKRTESLQMPNLKAFAEEVEAPCEKLPAKLPARKWLAFHFSSARFSHSDHHVTGERKP